MKNLLIGSTSQLSYYFPEFVDKISSRSIDYDYIRKKKYDKIFILFAEQRTYLDKSENFFTDINVDYTLEVIDNLKYNCGQIYIFSTSELWNKYSGPINIKIPYDYFYSPYIKSKEILCNIINENKEKYLNVRIIYPFNFNSPYRGEGFLFGKIFDSIINKKKIEIGSFSHKRDIIHPKIIVDNLMEFNDDTIIGSGNLIDLNEFFINLYNKFSLNFDEFVIQNNKLHQNKRNEFFCEKKYSNTLELINLTYDDISKYTFSKRHNK